MKKNLIIAGYPKSGTTWLTHLTADLVGAPVKGMFSTSLFENLEDNYSSDTEFECYKSHHRYKDIEKICKKINVFQKLSM